jgi:hypothetical protein
MLFAAVEQLRERKKPYDITAIIGGKVSNLLFGYMNTSTHNITPGALLLENVNKK